MRCHNKRPKIMLVPYPAQGHVTPMLKLALTFFDRGFDPIMVIPEFIHGRIASNANPMNGITYTWIPDGLGNEVTRDFFAIDNAMENHMPIQLERIVQSFDEDGEEVVCMIVDLLASWAIGVANRCGIPVAGFWPAMLASYRLVAGIPAMVRAGIISATGNPQNPRHHIPLLPFQPNQPKLCTGDLPWLIGTPQARKSRFNFWVRILDRSSTLPWILVNSFPNESLSYEENYFQLGQPMILPVIGSHPKHSIPKSPSFWEEDMTSLKWLETQKPKSVLYISFGSWVSPIGESNIKTLALTLESLGQPFIWVLGSNWRQGLPNGFIQRVSKQGKIVSWAPQFEILNHRAVGGYLTHCGWNSTMEAIQCGMRLLCYPIAGDQFVNCKFIVQVWRIGVRIDGFGLKDVEEGLKKVVEEDDEMNERLMKVRERFVGEKYSLKAKINISTFIDDLKRGDQQLNIMGQAQV